jgi:hypothetical protein
MPSVSNLEQGSQGSAGKVISRAIFLWPDFPRWRPLTDSHTSFRKLGQKE